jgi:hypothetical protein
VIALSTKRNRWSVPLAALLLMLQGLAGGAVALAHASEPLTAPAHVEARHDAGCLALHDELRCALCHYAGSQVVLQPTRPAPAATRLTEALPGRAERAPAAAPRHLTAPPRAPPGFRS